MPLLRSILILLTGAALCAAAATDTATVRIEPRNGTADAPGLGAGLPLTISQHVEEHGEQTVTQLETDEHGRAIVELDLSAGSHFNINLEYQGVDFSRHVVLEGDERHITVPIDVYETTDSPAGLRAMQHHVLLAPTDGALQVREIIVIEQADQRVHTSRDGAPTLALSLPAGFHDLKLNKHGAGLVADAEQGLLTSSDPIMPGKTIFDLEYSLPLPVEGLMFSKSVRYPTSRYLVMMAQGEYQLASNQLNVSQETMGDGVTLQTVLCEELAADQVVQVQVQPGPGGTAAMISNQPLHATGTTWLASSWIWALVGGVLVILVLAIGLKRQPRPAHAVAGQDIPGFLQQQLDQLESAYRDNQVTRQYYGQAKQLLKDQLERWQPSANQPG